MEQLPRPLQEYLQMKHEESMLKDQLQSVRGKIRQLTAPVTRILQSTPENTIPLTPTDDEANVFGDPGYIRIGQRVTLQQFSRDVLLAYSVKFYQTLFPDSPEMAQLFATQHTDFLMAHRQRSVTPIINRVSSLEQERQKMRKRMMQAENPRTTVDRRAKKKTRAEESDISSDAQIVGEVMRNSMAMSLSGQR